MKKAILEIAWFNLQSHNLQGHASQFLVSHYLCLDFTLGGYVKVHKVVSVL